MEIQRRRMEEAWASEVKPHSFFVTLFPPRSACIIPSRLPTERLEQATISLALGVKFFYCAISLAPVQPGITCNTEVTQYGPRGNPKFYIFPVIWSGKFYFYHEKVRTFWEFMSITTMSTFITF